METRYVGFWYRFLAVIIDGIIYGLASTLLGFLIGTTSMAEIMSDSQTMNLDQSLVDFLVGLVYYASLESSKFQGTLAKHWLGIKVQTVDGAKLTFAQAAGRYVSKILSVLTLGIGYMMAGWTKKKQGLHDKIANTVVVYK